MEHKPMCKKNMSCAVLHLDGKCEGFKCDCGAEPMENKKTNECCEKCICKMENPKDRMCHDFKCKCHFPKETKHNENCNLRFGKGGIGVYKSSCNCPPQETDNTKLKEIRDSVEKIDVSGGGSGRRLKVQILKIIDNHLRDE